VLFLGSLLFDLVNTTVDLRTKLIGADEVRRRAE
jgi:hypothetical protein